ncbi:MAG TPA: hypothetical protein VHE78_17955 [Gemmatimonadaceae bacterium]|nr:hypothetical protein [Gemmatimonadaceae bacterium]
MPDGYPFQLSGEQMRALGARATEMVIHHFETNRGDSVARTLTRADTERLLRTPLPEQGNPGADLLDLLGRDVFPNALKSDHPRFYAFVPSPTNFVSVIGDLLTSGYNPRTAMAQRTGWIPPRRGRHSGDRRVDGELVRHADRSETQIDAITRETVDRMREDGYALVLSTALRGRAALRLCPIHPGTTVAEIEETIGRLSRFARAASGAMPPTAGPEPSRRPA